MVEVSYHFLLHISNSTEKSREGRKFSIRHFQNADNTSCFLLKILHKLHTAYLGEIGNPYVKVYGNTRWFFCMQTGVVCYKAIFNVVTQCLWGGALRDNTKNSCVAH